MKAVRLNLHEQDIEVVMKWREPKEIRYHADYAEIVFNDEAY